MKLLFVVIIKNDEYRNALLNEMNKFQTTGTVITTGSIKNAILQPDVEPIPNFGGLRQLYENQSDLNTTILAIIDEEDLAQTKAMVRSVSTKGATYEGIMFTLPINDYETLTD